jgi:phosphotransferase system enzyme I (PtsI)
MEAAERQPSVTEDGTEIVVQGNIGRPADLDMARDHAVDGIGLYRTEFNYLSRSTLPEEDMLVREYGRAAAAFSDDGVVLRVLDIGGDKFPPSIPLAHEENPFLALRGLRLMLRHQEDLMLPQMRAMMRASSRGPVSILYPMVASVGELRQAREAFERALQEVRDAGHSVRDDIRQGIMVEVPSCITMLPELLDLCDFATVGTNDLVQYALAADRNSERMVDVYDPYYPSILRMLKRIIDTAQECDTEMGVCGEIAGDLEYLPVLIGLGYRKFSVNFQAVARLRHLIRTLAVEQCAELAERVVQVATRDEVHELTAEFSQEMGSEGA